MNRINLICLGVKDLEKSLLFYKNIGFQTQAKEDAGIVFFNNQGTKLELFPIEELVKDINADNPPEINQYKFSGITLACNMKSKQEVDDLFLRVKEIDGVIVKEPQVVEWGGYSGYFQDPDGYYWEVAYADSWEFDENDMLVINF
ncbi:hypothetical protein DOK78_001934 [Enterococcus sp. DIV2402]|uniref:VOC domain-containing protein n=1 Tax=Candidatus Enterococcus lowellii TaxID=2230877 RepID=A0ABZ2SND5_9ENTE|nr:VOC family protein [Enterococcus sp. DIV2402]MBO0463934.1 VOC family protein [Enterococcus sp. DIV2402]